MDAQLALPGPGDMAAFAPRQDAEGVVKAISIYRRQAPLFFAVLALFMALAYGFSALQTPRYTATASVMVTPHRAEVGTETATEPTDPIMADANVDSQVEVLKSGLLAGAVVDRLGLTRDRAFLASLNPPSRMPGAARPLPPLRISRGAAVDQLQKALAVHRVAQTLVIEVAYTSADKALATRIADGFAQAFVAQSVGQKLTDSQGENVVLGGQLDKLRGQMEAAETAVAQYRAAHGLLNVQGSTMAEGEIASLDTQVAANRAAAAEATARLNTAQAQLAHGSHGDDLGESLNSPVVQELRKQREEVSTHLADLQVRFGDRFPEVVAAKHQIADIDHQIDAEIKRIISNLDAQNRVAQQRVNSLVGSVGSARGELASANAASVQLDALQRTADSDRTLYEGVLNRVKETQTQAVTAEPDARVTNFAALPIKPSSPKLLINLLVGLLLGTGAGVGAVILRQETDTGLRTLEDVEGRLHLRYFGALPTVRSSVKRARGRSAPEAMAQSTGSSLAESFRGLAAALVHSIEGEGSKIVAVTSALPKEGKTTAAVCLARIAAMAGLKVVLVDCDLRRPSVAYTCRLGPVHKGLVEVLDGRADLDEVLAQEEKTNLAVLPLAGRQNAERSPLDTAAMDRLLEELRRRFDLVLLDTPPVLPVIESRILGQKADAVVLMVRWRKTPQKAAAMAAHLLRNLGVRIAGAALTRVDLKAQARSGYGDPTFYYSKYKGYYVG